MDIIKDMRVECYSVMTKMNIKEYLSLVDHAYRNQGNLNGQRSTLKTKSAITIRKRMLEDIVKGTVLPPVVIGMNFNNHQYREVEELYNGEDYTGIERIIKGIEKDSISIIDGMQRTTSIIEAGERNPEVLERNIRVEFWVAKNVNSLIYRMLILNTGQVPWNLKRQMEIIYNPLLKDISDATADLKLIYTDDRIYRTEAGQYQGEKIVELFLVFGSRDARVDSKEALADEFTRMDFISIASDNQLSTIFVQFLNIMIEFDKIVYPLSFEDFVNDEDLFKNGKDLFGAQTFRAGFMAAIAQNIFGLPGEELSKEKHKENCEALKTKFNEFLQKMSEMSTVDLVDFIDIMTLNESITTNKGIGEYQRKFFTKSFELLISRDFQIESLTPCWRAGKR